MFTDNAWFSALIIFSLRLADVPVGTLRIGMLVQGYPWAAGILSFVESFMWLLATGKAITSMGSGNYLQMSAFAAGYALGTVVGVMLQNWLAVGSCVLQVITPVHSPPIAEVLREQGYMVTVINAEGRDGGVRIAYSVVPKRQQVHLLSLIGHINSKAFVTVENVSRANLQRYSPTSTEIPWMMRLLRR
jgi:uncharacterized protein YebE (UPF0316 family)